MFFRAVALATILAACSSQASPETTPTSPETTPTPVPAKGGGTDTVGPPASDPARCASVCCLDPHPVASGTCASTDTATTCPGEAWCPSGLWVEESALTCVAGKWIAKETCPPPNTVNERGCPGSQPSNGAACNAADGTKCEYYLECLGPPCEDAGSSPGSGGSKGTGCARSKRLSYEFATCSGGMWQTNPLGTCTYPQ